MQLSTLPSNRIKASMGVEKWCLLLLIMIVLFAIVCAEDGPASDDETPFPSCAEDVRCDVPCITEKLSLTPAFSTIPDAYSPHNVICVDNRLASPERRFGRYNIAGCAGSYFETRQRTDGVCAATRGIDTDLYLTTRDMTIGLHSFNCLQPNGSSSNSSWLVSGEAIVVNGDDPYSDLLLFVNGDLQNGTNVNVSITEMDNFTMVVRAVGNDALSIEPSVASPDSGVDATSRFRRTTSFLCNSASNYNVEGRYLQYSLVSPAKLSDNGIEVVFVINSSGLFERISVNITVRAKPTASLPAPGSSPTPLLPSPHEASHNNDLIIILCVMITLLILLVISVILILLGLYWRSRKRFPITLQKMEQDDYSSLGKDIRNKSVCIYTCEHSPVNQLVDRLRENKNFEVETFVNVTCSDEKCRLLSKLDQGAVLLDCSCAGMAHSDSSHKAVECVTKSPVCSEYSKKWKIIKLNNVETAPEANSSSWSVDEQVNVLSYTNLDDEVVDNVLTKIDEIYSSSWSSSVNLESDEVCTMKVLQDIAEQGKQVAAGQMVIREEFAKAANKLVDGQKSFSKELNAAHEGAMEVLDVLKENVEGLESGQKAVATDVLEVVKKSDY